MEQVKTVDDRLRSIETLLLSQKVVLNFEEVVAYTGLSKSHLYKLTSSKGIPHYKPMGKMVYFNKQEIDQWLLQNRKATAEEVDSKAATFVTLNNRG